MLEFYCFDLYAAVFIEDIFAAHFLFALSTFLAWFVRDTCVFVILFWTASAKLHSTTVIQLVAHGYYWVCSACVCCICRVWLMLTWIDQCVQGQVCSAWWFWIPVFIGWSTSLCQMKCLQSYVVGKVSTVLIPVCYMFGFSYISFVFLRSKSSTWD